MGHVGIVRLLLEAGAQVYFDGDSGLIIAASWGYIDILHLLLEYGVDNHANDDEALRIAVLYSQIEAARVLLASGANVNDYTGELFLCSAIKNGDFKMVEMLMEAGADIHGDDDELPLQRAVWYCRLDMVEMLVRAGADVYTATSWAVYYALCQRHLPILRFLLGAGADRDYFDEGLLKAAAIGWNEGVLALLEAGADIHTNSNEALQLAEKYGNVHTVRCLLDAGADAHARSGEAMQLAVWEGHVDVVDLFFDCGYLLPVSERPALGEPIAEDAIALVHLLLRTGGETLEGINDNLRVAAELGHIEILRMLLAAGADVHASKDSAIYAAAWAGKDRALRFLLEVASGTVVIPRAADYRVANTDVAGAAGQSVEGTYHWYGSMYALAGYEGEEDGGVGEDDEGDDVLESDNPSALAYFWDEEVYRLQRKDKTHSSKTKRTTCAAEC
ncbi:hypothetical protein HDV00_012131 [Rhizophlyctis rosea]|nr:hypothetical protein HDV00_012131 [Rhizophlyctis rosea]